MMKILDIYKNPLYTLFQWDVNQYVNIVGINPDMPVSVQFWRAGQTEAFVVESTVSGNIVTAAIPNELLREPGELVIYIWQDTGTGEQKGGRTETFFNVPIKERAQPSDYIYDDNVEYISVKTVIEDAKEATTAANEATEAATSAAKLATDTAEDIKQKADSGEFDGKDGTDGKDGAPGAQGEPGQPGADGKSATITIGTVTTVSPDTPASVTNTGTETDAVFDFEIPTGQKGEKGEKGERGNPGLGVPVPTALDAGKIPVVVVNDNGSGYELKNQASQNLELIFDYTVEGEPVARLVIDKDMNGNPFNFRHIYIFVDVATAEGLGNGTGNFWLYLGGNDTSRRIIVPVDRTYIIKRAYIGQIHGLKGFASGSVQSTFLNMSKLDEVDGLPYVEFVCNFPDTFQFQNSTRIVIYGEGRI